MNKLKDLQKILEEALNCGDAEKQKNQLAAMALIENNVPKLEGLRKAKHREDGVVEIPKDSYYGMFYYVFLNSYMMVTSEAYRNSHYAKVCIKAGEKIIAEMTPELMERFLKEYTKEREKQ